MTLEDQVASTVVLVLLFGSPIVLIMWLRRVFDRWIGTRPPTQRQLLRRAARVANARNETETLEALWAMPTTQEPQP